MAVAVRKTGKYIETGEQKSVDQENWMDDPTLWIKYLAIDTGHGESKIGLSELYKSVLSERINRYHKISREEIAKTNIFI